MSERKGSNKAFTARTPHGAVKRSPDNGGALSFMRRPCTRDLAGVDVPIAGITLASATLAAEFLCMYSENPQREART